MPEAPAVFALASAPARFANRPVVPKPLHLIAACAENRVIGRDGHLPWRIPEDLAFLHAQTAGQIVVLGRICFETWPGAVQDGRRAVVVTRAASLAGGDVRTAASLPEALAIAETLAGDVYVCGGQRIFEEAIALPQARWLHLTLVHATVPGDRFFPEWRTAFPRVTARREREDAAWRYAFLTCER